MKTICVIGAGIVGCAIAHELAQESIDLHVLDINLKCGEGVTSRNSGVIHAGLYYPPHSLKSKLCQEGRELLYRWCVQKGVPHKKTGKLIVANTYDEEKDLNELYSNALASGVSPSHLIPISRKEILKINPNILGVAALHSLETGIVDSQALCHSFYGAASQKSVQFHFDCKVQAITPKKGYIIHTSRGDIEADVVINAAGLYSDDIARMIGIAKYTIYPWRGDYFRVRLPYSIDVLVYPVRKQNSSGLGVHLTMDMRSQYYLGPDCEPNASKEDFGPRPEKLKQFYESASQLLHGLRPEMLSYETCGIRPKLRAFDSTQEEDFVISEDLPGFFNLIGIESPGLTASLAIARYLKQKL